MRMYRKVSAFSLVEVTIALGIVSFCLVPLLGLLPVGLKSVKNAHEESAAANVLNGLSSAIRDANRNISGDYVAGGHFSNIVWSGTNTTTISGVLSLAGVPPSEGGEERLAYRVEIMPPSADRTIPGRARISVSWPSTAQWSDNSDSWTGAEGVIRTGVQFLPR